jgi:hypothetical protein
MSGERPPVGWAKDWLSGKDRTRVTARGAKWVRKAAAAARAAEWAPPRAAEWAAARAAAEGKEVPLIALAEKACKEEQ